MRPPDSRDERFRPLSPRITNLLADGDVAQAPQWFRLDVFINGVGDWWMTAMDIETGHVVRAEGDKTAPWGRARLALIEHLWFLRGVER